MKGILKVVLLCAIIVLQYACKSIPVDIKLNLEKDKEYTQSNISTITTKISYTDGQTMDMAITIAGEMSYIVESITDTAYFVDVRYKKLSMTMHMPQGVMTFDSENANDIMSKSFNFLVNNSFKLILLKNGKVYSVDMASLWDKLESSMAEFPLPLMQRKQIVEQIKQAYGEKAFRGSFEQVLAFLPDKPISKGEKWHSQIELYSNFPATMNSEYELTKIGRDYFTIIGTSTISTNGWQDAIARSSNGELMKYDLTGTSTSNIKVDRKTGWIIESNIKQSMKGKSVIGDMQMSMEMMGDINYEQ